MNVKRMLLGGLLAGIWVNVSEAILNAGILMDDYKAMMADTGLIEADWAMVGYVVSALLTGFVVAWIYVAIRPRFGPGPATAVYAGLAVWVVGYAIPTVWFAAMGMTLSAGLTAMAVVWGLVELVIAGMIAGWVYQEEGVDVA